MGLHTETKKSKSQLKELREDGILNKEDPLGYSASEEMELLEDWTNIENDSLVHNMAKLVDEF